MPISELASSLLNQPEQSGSTFGLPVRIVANNVQYGPGKYIAVRLTDGISYYSATGSSSGEVSGTLIVNQGTSNTLSGAWVVKLTDGLVVLGTQENPIFVTGSFVSNALNSTITGSVAITDPITGSVILASSPQVLQGTVPWIISGSNWIPTIFPIVKNSSGVLTEVGYNSNSIPMPVNQTPYGSTYSIYADSVAFALNKHHITLFNGASSTKILRCRKLFAINLQTVALVGVVTRFDIKKCTAASSGNALTINAFDSQSSALTNITAITNGTVAEGNLLFPWITSNEEETAVPALSKTLFQQGINILIEGDEIHSLVLRPGEGLTVKQITNSILGNFGWLMIFTAE
jgi:hypothetical protein